MHKVKAITVSPLRRMLNASGRKNSRKNWKPGANALCDPEAVGREPGVFLNAISKAKEGFDVIYEKHRSVVADKARGIGKIACYDLADICWITLRHNHHTAKRSGLKLTQSALLRLILIT